MWEERVALYAGADLGTVEAAAVERHLSECVPCSALAADLRLELDELREVHAEPLASEHYAAVRGRVLAQLAKPSRRGVVWAWAVPVLAAAAAVLVVVTMRKPAARPAPELPRLVAIAPAVESERGSDRSLTVAAPIEAVRRAGTTPSGRTPTRPSLR